MAGRLPGQQPGWPQRLCKTGGLGLGGQLLHSALARQDPAGLSKTQAPFSAVSKVNLFPARPQGLIRERSRDAWGQTTPLSAGHVPFHSLGPSTYRKVAVWTQLLLDPLPPWEPHILLKYEHLIVTVFGKLDTVIARCYCSCLFGGFSCSSETSREWSEFKWGIRQMDLWPCLSTLQQSLEPTACPGPIGKWMRYSMLQVAKS